uniref:Si:ch211-220f12.4 n=1 Tax=Salarias fasciatus TaxID=181472 RepID=A0A672GEI5_SALFA
MEIKRQITGMMRLLSDKSSRAYHRAGAEQDGVVREPQERHLNWAHQPALLSLVSEDHQSSSWNSAGDPVNEANGTSPARTTSNCLNHLDEQLLTSTTEVPCCMCNCKGTLQAILQELRTMRRLMQTQKGENRQHPPANLALVQDQLPAVGPERGGQSIRSPRWLHAARGELPRPLWRHRLIKLCFHNLESRRNSEVRLAEDYDVFISKAQLDSILVNYTRSGSLLFRKLVCAFFDDTTLANSLPNGKRKRGLNDNRKGLDQNIVGAIKGRVKKDATVINQSSVCTANMVTVHGKIMIDSVHFV